MTAFYEFTTKISNYMQQNLNNLVQNDIYHFSQDILTKPYFFFF